MVALDVRCDRGAPFDALLGDVLDRLGAHAHGTLDAALGIAGPVRDGRAWFTNLPWHVDADALRVRFGLREVTLVNDLAAAAHALAATPPDDALVLQPGRTGAAGRSALISVGTGLGVACWSGAPARVDATEAGHAAFAPADSAQRALLDELAARLDLGRVSWERLLSGAGLALLRGVHGGGGTPPAAEVVALATRGEPAARAALHDLALALGAFAGDLVLAAPADGGVWLTGGVLEGLGAAFPRERFLAGFRAKGRLSPLLRDVPVRQVHDPALGLRGAWILASQRCSASAARYTAA